MLDKPQRYRILGIPVDHVSMAGCLEKIDTMVANGCERSAVLAINPEKVIALQARPDLQEIFEAAAILIPDGIGVVAGLRLLYGIPAVRVAGAELMPNICALAAERGYKVYLYGATEDINRQAVTKLRQLFPGIQVAGRSNGYVPEAKMADLIADINSSRADILFIALGSPRQELWIQKYLPSLNVKICQGIGGTLDVITGRVKRAPALFRRFGLEWFYRLATDLGRAKRQLALPLFTWRLIKEKTGILTVRK